MTSSALTSRYASALVDVAAGPNSPLPGPQVLEQLRQFEQIFQSSPELRNALESPAVPPARKRAVLERFVSELNLARLVRNFLFVLSDHRRMAVLPEVVEAFDILLDERLGFVRADIRSAQELNPSDQDALATQLSHLSGKQVRMRFAVDPELIGGVVARVGSKVYDGSVRGQLAALGKRFTA